MLMVRGFLLSLFFFDSLSIESFNFFFWQSFFLLPMPFPNCIRQINRSTGFLRKLFFSQVTPSTERSYWLSVTVHRSRVPVSASTAIRKTKKPGRPDQNHAMWLEIGPAFTFSLFLPPANLINLSGIWFDVLLWHRSSSSCSDPGAEKCLCWFTPAFDVHTGSSL